jgi:hypothetical protein
MKNRVALFFGALFGAVFLFGIVRLFTLRFEAGDVYPPYSTLRADPLGAKVFFDALKTLPGIEAARGFRSIVKLKPDGGAAFFVLGLSTHAQWDEEEVKAVESFADAGGRVAVTFAPVLGKPSEAAQEPEQKAAPKPTPTAKPSPSKKAASKATPKPAAEKKSRSKKFKNDDEDDDRDEEIESAQLGLDALANRWNIEAVYGKPLDDEKKKVEAVSTARDAGDAHVSWHSILAFRVENSSQQSKAPWWNHFAETPLTRWLLSPHRFGEDWRVIYKFRGKPVIVERPWGRGTIVLASDSYFLSNEAMRRERHPSLLAWLGGSQRRVVFDETHFGVEENPGIASLARKYNLHGVVFALVVLAALFVWKNSTSFVPPLDENANDSEVVAGKDSAEGFVNLLRRSIAPRELLKTCVAEWRRTFGHRGDLREKLSAIESIAADDSFAKAREVTATYQKIAQLLAHTRASEMRKLPTKNQPATNS